MNARSKALSGLHKQSLLGAAYEIIEMSQEVEEVWIPNSCSETTLL